MTLTKLIHEKIFFRNRKISKMYNLQVENIKIHYLVKTKKYFLQKNNKFQFFTDVSASYMKITFNFGV